MESQAPATVGRYRITGELGRGAMGAVYRGVDPKLDRTVAIKMISSSMAGGDDRDEILARFEREARVSARLQHPNVVAVYDVGAEGDELYLVMELIDGDTLSHRLARGQFPSVPEGLEMIAQAADALAAAHEAGIIHRDIKPGNLLITKSGRVKVTDFGVAKAVGEKMELTRTGMMVGSPAYMSPEQVKGMVLDGRSDLFSLGVVLYELLLHRKPFPADTVTTLVYQILHEDPMKDVPIPDAISQDLADFIRWTLGKDREARVPDARTFASRARALAAGQPLPRPEAGAATALLPVGGGEGGRTAVMTAPAAPAARPAAPLGTTKVETPSSRTGLWVGVAAAVVVGGGLGFWLLGRGGDGEATAADAAAASAPAVQVQATSRPTFDPTTASESAPGTLSIAVPEEIPDDTPSETSGDGISGGGNTVKIIQEPAPPRNAAGTRGAATRPTTAPETTPEVARDAGATTAGAATSTAFAVPQVAIAETVEARRAVLFQIRPDASRLVINGVDIGVADDWDGFGGGKPYAIPYAGDYYVEITADGYETKWVKIVISPDARELTARIRTRLEKIKD
ncbi:MAG: serine/threonine protein kinase [Thermoanaerobaculia bacterium]|nr:serine/threonine protein kinase [Thermoanaerobaculia bacterium]